MVGQRAIIYVTLALPGTCSPGKCATSASVASPAKLKTVIASPAKLKLSLRAPLNLIKKAI